MIDTSLENTIVNALAAELEYYVYIRDDNINVGNPRDWSHGVQQGQVQAAERIMSKIVKIINDSQVKDV